LKIYQNETKLSQVRQRRGSIIVSRLMADPDLAEQVRSQGVKLQETGIGVLGIRVQDLKRLEDADINNIEHLALCSEDRVLSIPHFGIMKVRKIKTDLNLYLTSLLNEQNKDFKIQPENLDIQLNLVQPASKEIPSVAILNPNSELEAFAKSIDLLEKRMGSLESRLAKIKTLYQNNLTMDFNSCPQ
jgi:hypothetical protein